MRQLDRIWTLWTNGALFLFMLLVALVGPGLLVAMALTIGAEVAGLSSDKVMFWTLFTSPLWASLAIGYSFQFFPRDFLEDLRLTRPLSSISPGLERERR